MASRSIETSIYLPVFAASIGTNLSQRSHAEPAFSFLSRREITTTITTVLLVPPTHTSTCVVESTAGCASPIGQLPIIAKLSSPTTSHNLQQQEWWIDD